mgnify:CR=1 FL=1
MTDHEKPTLKKKIWGGSREGAGRPAFVPTDQERAQVAALSGVGLPQDQIACLVRDGIHVETLRSHFAKELAEGKAKANSQVARSLFQKAVAGDTASAIWWTKTQMRWSEVQKHEVSGPDGGAIQNEVSIFDAMLKNLEAKRQLGE